MFSTFTWATAADAKKIAPVLQKFGDYCKPRKNVPFDRYRFNRRAQEPGESYDQYRTALRKIAETCEFRSITPDEVLRDRLVFGIRDSRARERLLRENNLTLARTGEICHAAESMQSQIRQWRPKVPQRPASQPCRRPGLGRSLLDGHSQSPSTLPRKLHQQQLVRRRSVATVASRMTSTRRNSVLRTERRAENVASRITLL